tara:strand:+ start:1892 stop:2545 length:654 start_codon:yes stop_codon:yes gene_type:complete
MKFREFKTIIKESSTTHSITVIFTDSTIKTITDIPQAVFTSSSFEQDLRDKMKKNYPKHRYSRFTVFKDFQPTTAEEQQMVNVKKLYILIRTETAKLFDKGGENTPFPDTISFSYKIGNTNKSIDNVKKEFNITTYNNTKNPKSDEYGPDNAEGWPMTVGDYNRLKQMIINKLSADDVIVLGRLPNQAQRGDGPMAITVGGDSLQYKRELDMYKEGN